MGMKSLTEARHNLSSVILGVGWTFKTEVVRLQHETSYRADSFGCNRLEQSLGLQACDYAGFAGCARRETGAGLGGARPCGHSGTRGATRTSLPYLLKGGEKAACRESCRDQRRERASARNAKADGAGRGRDRTGRAGGRRVVWPAGCLAAGGGAGGGKGRGGWRGRRRGARGKAKGAQV